MVTSMLGLSSKQWESLRRLSDDGQITDRLSLLEPLGDIDCIKPLIKELKTPELARRILYILEFLVRNRKTISNDRGFLCLKNFQNIRSSPIPDQESTGKGKDCFPFWNKQLKEMYPRLLLPQKTDCVDSPLNFWNGSSEPSMWNSWFSTTKRVLKKKNSPTISYPLSKYFAAKEMEKDDTELIKTWKIKLNPSKKQKKILRRYWDGYRYTYNETVAIVEKEKIYNDQKIRNRIVTCKNNDYFDDRQWLLETPKAIRQEAVRNCVAGYKSNFMNLKNKNIKHFKKQYKKKKDDCWTFSFEKNNIHSKDGKLSIFPKSLGIMRYHGSLPFKEIPDGGCKMLCDSLGDFYIAVPIKETVKFEESFDDRPVVSIDPGCRKFLTTYTPDGTTFMIGETVPKKHKEMLEEIDRLAKYKGSQKRRRRLYLLKKLRDFRDELHFKSCNFLSKTYSVVLIGKLEVPKLVERDNRQLRTKTVRQMLSLSHGLFLTRLEHKCRYQKTLCAPVNESYTSKTCGSCGYLNDRLGSSETFDCPCCGCCIDRDINGARNILLRYLGGSFSPDCPSLSI